MTWGVEYVTARQVQDALHDGGEIALLDVREYGEYGEAHPFFAVNVPFSRLEIDVERLVPCKRTRVVVYGHGNELAARAADRLNVAGYEQVRVLEGGTAAWTAAGFPLFAGVNVPSKAFGELAERVFGTPRIAPAELADWQKRGQSVVVLDGRPFSEYARMNIPGGICCPNGELAYRWRELVPDEKTPVVVNCAGRTRSIIGAQTLINFGVRNPVYALENGTQGWMLADLPLHHGGDRRYPDRVPDASLHLARRDAEHLARRFAVPAANAEQLHHWLSQPERTTYLLDVRTAEEFNSQSLRGARHATGGQLIQATDQYVAVRGARLVLFDSEGVRAKVVASWLRQMGWDAWELENGLHSGWALRGAEDRHADAPKVPGIAVEDLAERLRAHAVRVVDLRSSADYRKAHIPESIWSIRPRLRADLADETRPLVFVADDEVLLELAAADLGKREIRRLEGGFAAWQASGHLVVATPDLPPDRERIDYLFFTHDRHEGNKEAAHQYLAWEIGLLDKLHPTDASVFRPGAPT